MWDDLNWHEKEDRPMKKPRYTPGQVAFDLRQPEESAAAAVCRNMGISEQTFHLWNKRFRGIGGGRKEEAVAPGGEEPEAEAIGNRP